MRHSIYLCVLCTLFATGIAAAGSLSDDFLPYDDDTTEPVIRKYRVGAVFCGMKHVGTHGFGLTVSYGHLDQTSRLFNFGVDGVFITSGEQRVNKNDAYNDYFLSDSLFSVVDRVYETTASVGLGGTAFHVFRPPSSSYGLEWPGIAIGLSAGVMIETDRVGLRSSDYEYYYGTVSYSDTNINLRPYIRPQLALSQNALTLTFSTVLLARFPTWMIGLAYAW